VVFGVTGATSVTHTVTISDPAKGLSISSLSIQLSGADLGSFQISNSDCGTTLAPGTDCTLMLTFTHKALGAAGATLVVSDSAISNAGIVMLKGTGVRGKLIALPGRLGFGKVQVGTSSA
jgi:hypothetical protein